MEIVAVVLLLGGVGLLVWVVTTEEERQGQPLWVIRAAKQSRHLAQDLLLAKVRSGMRATATRLRSMASRTRERAREAGERRAARPAERRPTTGPPSRRESLLRRRAGGRTRRAPGVRRPASRNFSTVTFEQSFDLTAVGPEPARAAPFVAEQEPVRRPSRVVGLIWLITLVALAATAVAMLLWGAGQLVMKSITNYFSG
jgi:hypothetical protein